MLAAGLVGAVVLGGGVAHAAVTPEPVLKAAEDDVLAVIDEAPDPTTASVKVAEGDLLATMQETPQTTVQTPYNPAPYVDSTLGDDSTFEDVAALFSALVAADRPSTQAAATMLDRVSTSARTVDCAVLAEALSEQDWSLLGDQDQWLYGYADVLAYSGGGFAIDPPYSAEDWTVDGKSTLDGCQ